MKSNWGLLDSFIFCMTQEKVLVHCFSCLNFLFLFLRRNWIKNPWYSTCYKDVQSNCLIRTSLCMMEPVVLSWKGIWIDFPLLLHKMHSDLVSLCWFLNTTLGDSWCDWQKSKDVPVLSIALLLVLSSRGQVTAEADGQCAEGLRQGGKMASLLRNVSLATLI